MSTAQVASGLPLHSLLRSPLGAQLALHVSLSAPLVLSTDQRDGFLSSFKQAIGEERVEVFGVHIKDVVWVSNEDLSRYFLVLRLQETPKNEFGRLVRACNAVASNFGLSQLYEETSQKIRREKSNEDDKFHISIAWQLQAPSVPLAHRLEECENNFDGNIVSFDSLHVKIGNVVNYLALAHP